MRELNVLRRRERENAQRAVGRMGDDDPVIQAHVDPGSTDNELLDDAVEVEDCDIQGAGGGFNFIEGFSVVDGSDPIK